MAGKSKTKFLAPVDLNARGGGRVRVWQSVDVPGKVCLDTFLASEQSTLRLSSAELSRLIRTLQKFREKGERRG